MRGSAAIAVAVWLAMSGQSIAADRFQVVRHSVSLWSSPDDDARPQISGTVVRVEGSVSILKGGARVPATGAAVGETATFACREIDEDDPPRSQECVLVKATRGAPPPKRGDAVKLWD